MRNKFGLRPMAAALCTLLLLVSCSSDNNFTISMSPDCSLTSVVLGALKRKVETQTTEGKDTVVNTTYNAAYYRMNIDELNRRVYNPDSLPRGTDVTKVTFSSMAADGSIFYRDLKTGRDTTYISTDSLDFSEPRLFTILSSDGTGRRTYTVQINVRNADSQAFTWRLAGTDPAVAATTPAAAFVLNGRLTVLARTAGGQAVCLQRSAGSGAEAFASQDISVLDEADLAAVCYKHDTLYAVAGDALYASTDGCRWTAVETAFRPVRLLGCGSAELYAQAADGRIWRSKDALTWTEEDTDTDTGLLPTGTTRSAYEPLLANPNLEAVVLTGFHNGEQRIWKKVVDLTGAASYAWSYLPVTEENRAPLQPMDSYSLLSYDSRMLAWGMKDGQTVAWCSADGGRTWLTDAVYKLPAAMQQPDAMACAVADGVFIWVVCGGTGEVWRGYLNRLNLNPGEN